MKLVVEQLDYSYGKVRALEGINVETKQGSLIAILGPNASGKSTLLKCILGSLHPQSGRVMLDDRPIGSLKARELAQRIAYVPQRSYVSAAFTVREVVELGRYALVPDAKKVAAAIIQLDLAGVSDRIYSTLSVGQQQRVMMARAMAQLSPDGLLLLDEPTSAMDLKHVRETMGLLQGLARGGATVLLVVHDIALASQVADIAWLLMEGKLLASGPRADVLTLQRLQEVFQVPFERVESKNGEKVLLPETCQALKKDII